MSKRKKDPVQRNALAVRAGERSRDAGGFQKDKRQKRKNRHSWKKEWEL